MGTWAGSVNASAYAYQPGPSTQFSSLTESSLAGLGDLTDTFDADFAAYLLTLPAVGAGIPSLADDLAALEAAAADLATDEFTPILTDLGNLGPGLDANLATLTLLSDFGSSPLAGAAALLSTIESALTSIVQAVVNLQAWIPVINSEINVCLNDISEIFNLLACLSAGGW
jgi:hypothetical protein